MSPWGRSWRPRSEHSCEPPRGPPHRIRADGRFPRLVSRRVFARSSVGSGWLTYVSRFVVCGLHALPRAVEFLAALSKPPLT